MHDENKRFYNNYWSKGRIFQPENWGHWDIINSQKFNKSLEIGPGNKPKTPIKGGTFVDVSVTCLDKIESLGGEVVLSTLQGSLPFKNDEFDLVCCFEVLEHLDNDAFVISEVHRVLQHGGRFILSVPIGMEHWSNFDKFVGHKQRYDAKKFAELLESKGFKIVTYSLLDMPWAGDFSAAMMITFAKLFPRIFVAVGDFIDTTPLSYMNKPFHFVDGPVIGVVNKKDTTLILNCEKV